MSNAEGPTITAPARPARWRSRLGTSWRPAFSWKDVFAAHTPEAAPRIATVSPRSALLEWALLAVVVFSFCGHFLDLGSTRILTGNESEIVQSLDWALTTGLKQGQFPVWNPYLKTGLPYVADPFLHVYNPLSTLPVLLFGVTDGFKIALFLSVLVAALGMWRLAVGLDFGRGARLWTALMYAFTGQAVARFFQGEYDFVLGYAWIPWVIGGVLIATRTHKRLDIAIAALSAALLFMSGNVYYSYYMLFVLIMLALVTIVDVQRIRPYLTIHPARVATVALIGLLAVGIIAVQLLPLVDFWHYIVKVADPNGTGAQSLGQILLDYLSKDPLRADAVKVIPREEFYAYTGIWPFFLLLLLPFVAWKRQAKPLLFFISLLVLTVAWIDVRQMPWSSLYERTPFLNQFRYPTRMLIYGALALITLAGFGLDRLWKSLPKRGPLESVSVPGIARWVAGRAGLLVLVVFIVWSIGDVYAANSRHAATRDPDPPRWQTINWLRAADKGEYFVTNVNDWHSPIAANALHYVNGWYGFDLIRPLAGSLSSRYLEARPNYDVLGNDRQPSAPDAVAVQSFPTHTIYKYPHNLPFAFAVANAKLFDNSGKGELLSDDVTTLAPHMPNPNTVDVTANGGPDSTLVVMQSAYPGWQLSVDGQPQPVKNVSGYLAADLFSGTHRYVFTYRSLPFTVGLVISLLSLLALAAYLVLGWLPRRRQSMVPLALGVSPAASDSDGIAVVTGSAAVFRPKTVDAVYQAGALVPDRPLDLPDGLPVRVTVRPALVAVPLVPELPGQLAGRFAPVLERLSHLSLEWGLFGFGLALYLITRLRGLTGWPIYFLTDEAANPVRAADLIARGFHDANGHLFPMYWEVAPQRWGPLLSVYIHALTMSLFGESIFVTRATTALFSVLAAISIALILKLIFNARFWWAGPLLLAIVPAWFLHSRTGFETVIAASFYACFLLFYLLYRTRSPRYLYPAVLVGMASFYTYSNGELIMVVAGVFLFLSDVRYHIRQWRTVLKAAALLALLSVPLLLFRMRQPESLALHLRVIDSYWFRSIPLSAKIAEFIGTYAYGLSPAYWFIPNDHDLVRHHMLGYPNIGLLLVPMVIGGVALCLWRVRSSTHRAVLLAALATPAGAALVGISMTRVIAFVVPAVVLAGLGLDWLLTRLSRRIAYGALAAAVVAVLSLVNIYMLRDAVVNGPLWFRDYQLYGMQFGTRQLFQEAVPEALARDPNTRIMLSPNWANGTDLFVRFFLSQEDQSRVQMRTVDDFMQQRNDLTPDMLFIMMPEEYQKAVASGKFKSVNVEKVIPYPDGSPGFYFARLAYADNVDKVFAAEEAARRQPVVEQYVLDGQPVTVSHSQFEAGQLSDLFDGDPFTFVRGREANPLVLEFTFSQPRTLSGLAATFGSMDFDLTARLYSDPDGAPVVFEHEYRNMPPDPQVELQFGSSPQTVSKLRLEIKHLTAGPKAKIHVRELKLK
jgi:hypothetical protein